ncbi:hypothetical protein [uncultured Levyella sp.]|uniref:hypothetical protein n=1 Tax=uncultured Levyella sp. TaxID=1715800 RepID=UPI00258A794B|nr:hypothetical protein [uncultured Levyella sp.]
MNRLAEDLIVDLQKIDSLSGEGGHQYWFRRFKELSFEDDLRLRDAISELEDSGFLTVSQWADNIPWVVHMTENGKNYSKNKTLFLQSGSATLKWLLGIIAAILAGLVIYLLTK